MSEAITVPSGLVIERILTLELVRSAPLVQAGDEISFTANVVNMSARRAKRVRLAVAREGAVRTARGQS